jgi:hypothetical protein
MERHRMAEGQPKEKEGRTVLRVVDVLDHPHGGRIARVRVQNGTMPSLRSLRETTLLAEGPRGEERRLKVLGFALTGGRVSDARIRGTGRVDLHVEEEGEGPPVDLTWRLTPI